MSEEHVPPISDPLLRPDRAPRDARGTPVRAPLGNSIRTLLLFGLLLAIGVAVWWLRRPGDLTMQLGGREWVIVEVDGEPAVNAIGTASTFVLDGTGEVRGAIECNTSTGSWSYDRRGQQLVLDWETTTAVSCPDGWPRTYLPVSGRVDLDGGELRIESDAGDIRAVALVDHDPMPVDDLHGSWASGGHLVEVGERGRFDVGECRGAWAVDTAKETAVSIAFDDAPSGSADDPCALAAAWFVSAPAVPVEVGESVFLHHDRATFPLDRSIIRLDPAPENVGGTPP